MTKKKAGIILSSLILIVVIAMNLIFGGKDENPTGNESTQELNTEQPIQQEQQPENVIQDTANNQEQTQNEELNNEQSTSTQMTEEEMQNLIKEKIQEGIASELAKIQQESTEKVIDNTAENTQQETQIQTDNNPVKQDSEQPKKEVVTVQDGAINNMPPEDLMNVVFTKTETITITTKTVKKVSVDGVIMSLYELGTEGATYPIKLMVNNSAFSSVKEGDKLNVIYNVYKGVNNEDIINIVKVS